MLQVRQITLVPKASRTKGEPLLHKIYLTSMCELISLMPSSLGLVWTLYVHNGPLNKRPLTPRSCLLGHYLTLQLLNNNFPLCSNNKVVLITLLRSITHDNYALNKSNCYTRRAGKWCTVPMFPITRIQWCNCTKLHVKAVALMYCMPYSPVWHPVWQ